MERVGVEAATLAAQRLFQADVCYLKGQLWKENCTLKSHPVHYCMLCSPLYTVKRSFDNISPGVFGSPSTHSYQQLSLAITRMLIHHVKSEPYYYLLACDSEGAAGIAPICCINPIMSAFTQCSTNLPSMIVKKSIEMIDPFLPDCGIPRNSAL